MIREHDDQKKYFVTFKTLSRQRGKEAKDQRESQAMFAFIGLNVLHMFFLKTTFMPHSGTPCIVETTACRSREDRHLKATAAFSRRGIG
jgi:hypothetical protein